MAYTFEFLAYKELIEKLLRSTIKIGEIMVRLISAWIREGAAGACAPPEFSGCSTKHCDVPPRNFGDYLEIHCF